MLNKLFKRQQQTTTKKKELFYLTFKARTKQEKNKGFSSSNREIKKKKQK